VLSDDYLGQTLQRPGDGDRSKVDTPTRQSCKSRTRWRTERRNVLPGMFGRADVDSGEKGRPILTLPRRLTYNPTGAHRIHHGRYKKDAKAIIAQAQQVSSPRGPTVEIKSRAVLKGVYEGGDGGHQWAAQIEERERHAGARRQHRQPLNRTQNPTPQERMRLEP